MPRVATKLYSVMISLVYVALGCAYLSRFGCGYFGPSIRSTAADAERHFQPLVQALVTYQATRGAFPESLQDLIRGGFLTAIPEIPEVSNASSRPVVYVRRDDGRSCLLSVQYHVYCQGIGPGDTTFIEWEPGKGWVVHGPGGDAPTAENP